MWRGLRITTLRYRLVAYVVVALIPLVVLNLLSQRHARSLRREAVVKNSLSIASATASAVRNFIDHVEGMERAAAIAFATDRLPMDAADAYLEEVRLTNPYFVFLVLVNKSGRAIASDRQSIIGRNYVDHSWFRTLSQQGQKRHVSPLFTTRPEGETAFVIAVGASDGSGLRLVLAGAIDPMALDDLTTTPASPEGDIAILDSGGRVVATNLASVRPGAEHGDRSYVPGVRAAITGQRGSFQNWRDPLDGVVRIGATVPVRDSEWVVVHMQAQDEAMEPVTNAQTRDLAALLAFGALSLLLAWFLGGRIAEPVRLLTQDAARLASGEMNVRSSIVRNDEIGQLAESFNSMAANLEVVSLVSHTATAVLDLYPLLDAVANEVCRTTGFDLCSVALMEEGGQHLYFAGMNVTSGNLVRWRRDEIGTTICGLAAVRKHPVVIEDSQPVDEVREALSAEGIASAASVPILSGDEVLGSLTVYSRSPRSIPDTQVRLLSSVASFAAIGIQNARSYERERRIAVTLQRSFLPDIPDRIGQFDIGHLYKPALGEAELGGDFYDFFRISEGVYGVAIGDVAGKGISAALTAVMSVYMVRGFASENPDPASALLRVNNALWRFLEPALFVTIFFGILDLEKNRIVFASAGHEPPLVYYAGRDAVDWKMSQGTAAGVVTGGDYESQAISLEQGDTLLLYTDGVVDARRNGEFFGQRGLEDAFAEGAKWNSAQELLDGMLRTIIDFSKGKQRDDIAMLAIKRT